MEKNTILSLDFTLALTQGTSEPTGITPSELAGQQTTFEAALNHVLKRHRDGELGFWGLPSETKHAESVVTVASQLPSAIKDVLVLGIGGSSLGGRTLCHALAGSLEVPPPANASSKRVYFVDNSDPWFLHQLLARLEPATTLVVAISKSGGTIETMGQLLVTEQWLRTSLGAETAKTHLVLITDPEEGPLRRKANQEGIAALDVPSNVGGRFSVLSNVGLFPAYLAGIDITALLSGARAMANASETPELMNNPAGLLAALHVLHHRNFHRNLHVLMPYADALRPFAAWYVQLWAESLGKRLDVHGNVVHCGPTPLGAIGATDQHSQLQLFAEGPSDKLLTFITVRDTSYDLPIPPSTTDFAYLNGKSLHAMLSAEQQATAISLAKLGRPSLAIQMPRIDARSLGALLFLYEAATAFAGELYEINAFDQPGVEASKHYASALLERPGFSQYRQDLTHTVPATGSRYIIRCSDPHNA